MAMQIMTSRELRAHFDAKGGKINLKGFGNHLLPGFEDVLLAAKPTAKKKAAAKAAPSNVSTMVSLHLALMNRFDENTGGLTIPKGAYHELDRMPALPTALDYNDDPIPATYSGITVPSGSDAWFVQTFTDRKSVV